MRTDWGLACYHGAPDENDPSRERNITAVLAGFAVEMRFRNEHTYAARTIWTLRLTTTMSKRGGSLGDWLRISLKRIQAEKPPRAADRAALASYRNARVRFAGEGLGTTETSQEWRKVVTGKREDREVRDRPRSSPDIKAPWDCSRLRPKLLNIAALGMLLRDVLNLLWRPLLRGHHYMS